ncbi:uncharacterized protein BXZ73DRAFT_52220 [Epithele typhae]|uniref:uncharacterized protein n=1 Tax=Epithele typhae TaxID=378194 RepID=UPI0020078165|nr:uncharacterized protein BXZ73DRAFT_52220 [Epithele typhae]KAH9920196.1 hypothetical protein BXZ73DRAFT_52220 [Epithele typhae]
MDRGRSRDISPIAFARPARQHGTYTSPALVQRQATIHLYAPLPPACSKYTPAIEPPVDARDHLNHLPSPVPSSSRLPPSPQPDHSSLSTSPSDTLPRTHSSNSVFSDSSEPTPLEPLTPPDDSSYQLDRPLEYYDSPPSPPRTLQDQMQNAYALDNMLLAKKLLLKLQGIDVSGDDDPRIAAVRDEDFSSSFVPEGGLRLDAETEARIEAAERRALEAQKRREREARLRQCERIWENSARRHRGDKERSARAKEDADRARRDAQRREKEAERDRARRAEAARAARSSGQLRIARGQTRQLVCYDGLRNADSRILKATPAADRAGDNGQQQHFLYDIMPSPPSRTASLASYSPPTSRSPTDKDNLTMQRMQRELAAKHAKAISRSVAFTDMLVAMHGPLFPDDVDTPVFTRHGAHQNELLAVLLHPPEKSIEKGKCRIQESPKRVATAKKTAISRIVRSSTLDSVESDASTSSITPSSASTATRSGSWFSFGSKSSIRSTSTVLTTPSSSPVAPTKPPAILGMPFSASPPSDCPLVRRASSKPPMAPTIPAVDHPLALPVPLELKSKEHLAVGRGRPLTRRSDVPPSTDEHGTGSSTLVHRVSRSVSSILDMAAQFQRAYVKATMFSAGVDLYGSSSSGSRSFSRSRSPIYASGAGTSRSHRRNGLKPDGFRATSVDVNTFAPLDMYHEDESMQYQRTLIPLCPPSSDTLPAHERVFPIPPPLPRSPFRPQFAPGMRLSRMRPVANPVLLRLQALHNTCQQSAIAWQRGREGSLAAGKEKMVGVAWEGIGRSSLGWEVSSAPRTSRTPRWC